jgi:hypothetical protein
VTLPALNLSTIVHALSRINPWSANAITPDHSACRRS